MRNSATATVLFLSSLLVSGFALAQQPETAPGSNETQTTPVQPDRAPQQSDQARETERKSAEDTRVKRDWTTQRDEDRTGMDRMRRQQHMGRMMEDTDHRTTGGNWRMQRMMKIWTDARDTAMRIGRADASRSALNMKTATNFVVTATELTP